MIALRWHREFHCDSRAVEWSSGPTGLSDCGEISYVIPKFLHLSPDSPACLSFQKLCLLSFPNWDFSGEQEKALGLLTLTNLMFCDLILPLPGSNVRLEESLDRRTKPHCMSGNVHCWLILHLLYQTDNVVALNCLAKLVPYKLTKF